MDRSAAYAARWVAKSLVKAELCRRVLVQVSGSVKPRLCFRVELQKVPTSSFMDLT